jgi:hypothetical protein
MPVWYYTGVNANGFCTLVDHDLINPNGGFDSGNSTTGWTVGTVGASNFSPLVVGSEQASGTFSGSSSLTSPNFSACGSFRSPLLNGKFSNNIWKIRPFNSNDTSGTSQRGRARCRVWKSANADGSGATELTSSVLVGTTQVTSSNVTNITWTPGALTFTNEYLFFQIEWEITTAGTSSTDDSMVRLSCWVVETAAYMIAGDGIEGFVRGTAITGGVGGFPAPATSYTLSMTTADVNRLVLVVVASQSQNTPITLPYGVSSVTSPNLTFQLRAKFDVDSGFNGRRLCLEYWWAYATAQLTNETITIGFSAAADQFGVTYAAFAMNNVPLSKAYFPFTQDFAAGPKTSGGLISASGNWPLNNASLTTTVNNTFVIGISWSRQATTYTSGLPRYPEQASHKLLDSICDGNGNSYWHLEYAYFPIPRKENSTAATDPIWPSGFHTGMTKSAASSGEGSGTPYVGFAEGISTEPGQITPGPTKNFQDIILDQIV